MINKKRTLFFIFLLLLLIPVLMQVAYSEDSFENTMKKIDKLEGKNVAVEYDKIQPLKNQYCFIKVEIKQLNNGEIVKQEVVECADGRKAYDGPTYWELFAQFYYRDVNVPEYCRQYSRPKHVFKSFGKTCLQSNGEWEIK